ncbi:MAG: 23S rRNA (uracil(1939)-C(5))-methyltransferase RlmD [Lachnospiraceae bacterium]|nr:23S rRNA (uracil(1939)-C(5))-methyltransferase RlmD [Lachnospiraceae bacterium]
MKKGQILEGIVERVDFPNKGIVVCEEGSCVVKNALPGQKVSFGVNKVRKGRAEGRLLEVIEKSPLEMESPCPHFGACGGCSYQTLPYEEQLKLKEAQVKRLLTPVLSKQEKGIEEIFEPIIGSPVQFGYRNKMEFSFGDEIKDGPLALGMHKRGSFYDIVTVKECQIVDEDYRLILNCVLNYFDEKKTSFYHRLRHTGYLRHLLVRKARRTGEILIALVTTTQEETELFGLVERLLALQESRTEDIEYTACDEKKEENGGAAGDRRLSGRIVGILHTKNDSVADVVKSDETIVLYGQDYFYEELLGLKFKISEFSFFQTNSLGAEVLYEKAREYIGDLGMGADGKPDKVLFDLYSGTGTIAQMMAPVAKKVVGVEIVEEAVEAAKKNAELNGLTNCEFIAGDVLKVLSTIEEKPDLIILDPPRDGIHPKALDKILSYDLGRMIYISCKPTSLVRDLEVFLENGYEVEKVCCVDMFPGTPHVETICLLTRRDK